MPTISRTMTPDGEKPQVGSTARTLGVRPGADIPVDSKGKVSPNTGGMSVAPSLQDLPPFRIPARLAVTIPDACGNDQDRCWRMGTGPFVPGEVALHLRLRPDSPHHATVQPEVAVPINAL